jgi:transposase-like protein
MKRKVFTKEFKLEAVQLLERSGRAAAEVARELGVRQG